MRTPAPGSSLPARLLSPSIATAARSPSRHRGARRSSAPRLPDRARRAAAVVALATVAACARVAARTAPLPDPALHQYARLLAMADARQLDTALIDSALV